MDKSKVFTSHKRLNRKTTVKDVPADCHHLKGAIFSQFNGLLRMKDFDALKLGELASFILTHHPTCKTKRSIQSKCKKPRTVLKDALEDGVLNLISVAYSLPEVKSSG